MFRLSDKMFGPGGGSSDADYGRRRRNPSDDYSPPSSLGINESNFAPLTNKKIPERQVLINQSLNFHGQQLTSFMREKFGHIDHKAVDYHLYQQVPEEIIRKMFIF